MTHAVMNWPKGIALRLVLAVIALNQVAGAPKKPAEPAGADLTDLMTEEDYDLLTDTFRKCSREADGVVKKIYLEDEQKEKADKGQRGKTNAEDKNKGKTEEQIERERENDHKKAAEKLQKQRFDVSFCYSCKWLMRVLASFLGEETRTKRGCTTFDSCWETELKDSRLAKAKSRFIQKLDIDDAKNPKAAMVALNCHMEKDRKADRIISAGDGAVLRKIYASCAMQVTQPPNPLPATEVPPPDFGQSFAEMIRNAKTEDGKPLKDDEKMEMAKTVDRAKKGRAYRAITQQLAREDRYQDLAECRKCSQNDWFKRSTDKKEDARKICVDLRECFIKDLKNLDENDLALKKKFEAYYEPKYEEAEFRHLHKVVHCQVADAVSSAQDKVPDQIKDVLVDAYKSCAEELSNKGAPGGRVGPFKLQELVDDYGTCSPCTLGNSFRKLIETFFSRSDEKCAGLASCFVRKLPAIKEKFLELKKNEKYLGAKGEDLLRMRVHCEFYERLYADSEIQEEDRPILQEIFRGCMKKANDEDLLKRCFPCNSREKLQNSMQRLKAAMKRGLDWRALFSGKEVDAQYTSNAKNYECEAVWDTCFLNEVLSHAKRSDDEQTLAELTDDEKSLRDAALRVDVLADNDDPAPLMKLVGELKCAVDDEEKVKNQISFEERLQLARVMHNCQASTILYEMASVDTVNPNVLSNGGSEIVPDPDGKFSDLKNPVDAAKVAASKKPDEKATAPFDLKHPQPLPLDAEKETEEERDGFRQMTKCYTCNDPKYYQVAKRWSKFKRWYKYHGACGEMRKCFRDRIRKKEANIEATLSDKTEKYFKTDDSLDYLMRAVNCPQNALGYTIAYKDRPEKFNEMLKKGFGHLESYALGIANKHWKTCIEEVIKMKPEITLFEFICVGENQVDFRTCMDTVGDRKGAVKVFFSKIISKIMAWTVDKTLCWQYKAATARWKRHLGQNPEAAQRWKRSHDHSPKMKVLIKIAVVVIICGVIASFIVPGTLMLTGGMAVGVPAVGTQVKVGCAAWATTVVHINGKLSTTSTCVEAIYHTLATTAECVAWAASQTHKIGVILEVVGSIVAVFGAWFATVFVRFY